MQAILKFNLPEDRDEFILAQRGASYQIALDEIDNHLRSKMKYENLSDAEYHLFEQIRNFVSEKRNEAEERF